MNEDTRKADLQKAIAEWKKKRSIRDNDPLMATLELWEILMHDAHAIDPHLLFRQELEKLTEISKALSKQSSELTSELRSVPKIKGELWAFPYFTVVLTAVGAIVIGIFIGKFLFAQ